MTKKIIQFLQNHPWIFPFIFCCFIFYYQTVMHPLPFWNIQDDYPWYSLSQAFTLHNNILGYPTAINQGYGYHPSIPFAIISWLAMLCTVLVSSPLDDFVITTIENIETYWFFISFFTLCITLAGTYILWKFFDNKFIAYLISVGFYFAFHPIAISTISYPRTDVFALIYVATFLLTTKKLFEAFHNKKIYYKCISNITVHSVLIGLLITAGWSIKSYYLGIPLAIFIVGILGRLKKIITLPQLLETIFITTLSFGISSYAIVRLFLKKTDTLIRLINWNTSIATASSKYGSSEKNFINLDNIKNGLNSLWTQSDGNFFYIFGIIVLLTIFYRFFCKKENSLNPTDKLLFIGISIAIILFSTIILKHYADRYTLILISSIICLPYFIPKLPTKKIITIPLTVFTLFFLCSTTNLFFKKHKELFNSYHNNATVEQEILTLPLQETKIRLWPYYYPSKAMNLLLISEYTQSQFVKKSISDFIPQDLIPSGDRTGKGQYLIFSKKYFPTFDSIIENYSKHFHFNKAHIITKDNEFIDFPTAIVVILPQTSTNK